MSCIKRKNEFRVSVFRNLGFTLIEIIIVSAMLGLISVAIYTTFSNGAKIWQRLNQNIAEEDLNIFLDKFTKDLRNSFKFSTISFLGQEERLEFAALVYSPTLNKTSAGKIIYFYDPGQQSLSREQLDFSQIYNSEGPYIKQKLENIKSLKFQYYIYDPQKKEYLWQQDWAKENLPLAVKIEFEFDNGSQTNKFYKTVSIPVSG